MSNYKAFSFIVSGVVATMAIVCHLGVQALDKATAQQCRTHDWPQAAHQSPYGLVCRQWLCNQLSP
jgi:hypothetical protein